MLRFFMLRPVLFIVFYIHVSFKLPCNGKTSLNTITQQQ